MDAVEAVKVAGSVIAAFVAVATFIRKISENKREIRAHSFATKGSR